jgi:precorrin-6B methylase 2
MQQASLVILLILFLGIAALWVLVPAVYGLPPVSTDRERIRRALHLARLQPGETLYDLGSGHGRVLIIAAVEFDAHAVGIEAGPVQCAISLLNALWHGAGSRVRVRAGDMFRADLSDADVVYAYLTSRHGSRLKEKLSRELRSGARVVTVAFDLPGWTPAAFDREHLIYLYEK